MLVPCDISHKLRVAEGNYPKGMIWDKYVESWELQTDLLPMA